MPNARKRSEMFDFAGAFEQAWIQYRSNILKILPFGILASIPPVIFLRSIWSGIILTILFEGFFLIILMKAIDITVTKEKTSIFSSIFSNLIFYLKNGIVLSLFMLPLLLLGFVLFVIPSVLIFSLFMFSFSQVAVKEKFAIDACMESYRIGHGYRLLIFLLSLIIYSSIILIYILTESHPVFFVLANGFLLPYFYLVIEEFFEQLEKK